MEVVKLNQEIKLFSQWKPTPSLLNKCDCINVRKHVCVIYTAAFGAVSATLL